jgi:hypothetical protein
MIAVNLADLTRIEPFIAQILVGPHVGDSVNCGPDIDDAAVVLTCSDERARAIVDTMRFKDSRLKRYATRAYARGPRGGWSKV